jgi:hypothetical protein
MFKGRAVGCLMLTVLLTGCQQTSDDQAVARVLGEQLNDQLGMALSQRKIDCAARVYVDVLGGERALEFASAGVVEMIDRYGIGTVSAEMSKLQQGMEGCFSSR